MKNHVWVYVCTHENPLKASQNINDFFISVRKCLNLDGDWWCWWWMMMFCSVYLNFPRFEQDKHRCLSSHKETAVATKKRSKKSIEVYSSRKSTNKTWLWHTEKILKNQRRKSSFRLDSDPVRAWICFLEYVFVGR